MSKQPTPNDSPSDPARQLRQLIEPDQQSRLELDSELLERYLQAGDRAAMERLVHRYAPLVASVCRLGTGCDQDAQDAFQATFLVLLQSARKIRRRSSLAAWLYGVAFRIAGRVRCQRMRSCGHDHAGAERRVVHSGRSAAAVGAPHDLDLLDRELQQLPDKLQGPLVEHYLLGYSVPEIAERMDLNISTIEGRLRRGRALLRTRLARRGISLSVALAGAGWFQQGLHAADASSWSAAFIEGTWEAGQTQVDPSSDPTLLSLVEGELSMLSVGSKSLLAAGLLIVFGSCLTAGSLGGDGAPQARWPPQVARAGEGCRDPAPRRRPRLRPCACGRVICHRRYPHRRHGCPVQCPSTCGTSGAAVFRSTGGAGGYNSEEHREGTSGAAVFRSTGRHGCPIRCPRNCAS